MLLGEDLNKTTFKGILAFSSARTDVAGFTKALNSSKNHKQNNTPSSFYCNTRRPILHYRKIAVIFGVPALSPVKILWITPVLLSAIDID